jgi:hypothetical protein
MRLSQQQVVQQRLSSTTFLCCLCTFEALFECALGGNGLHMRGFMTLGLTAPAAMTEDAAENDDDGDDGHGKFTRTLLLLVISRACLRDYAVIDSGGR